PKPGLTLRKPEQLVACLVTSLRIGIIAFFHLDFLGSLIRPLYKVLVTSVDLPCSPYWDLPLHSRLPSHPSISLRCILILPSRHLRTITTYLCSQGNSPLRDPHIRCSSTHSPDPPTTTLQRIKGLTTGSLPTFIDMGSNFGGSSILEDSIIEQLRAAGRKIAFMGDDTWTTVFPTAFDANMSFPFDSFNVEDLHTVDEGVIRHLFPLLSQKPAQWDFLIGHFLGVDHVGHRVGPDHPTMKAKLSQMNDVLRRVVDLLDDDTLLVVLGDHGMDRKGDHGGDGEHETSAALWIYSKGRPLLHPQAAIPQFVLSERAFPGSEILSRHVQQIDLVPSLSLLLGLPIPYNNLGMVIPELFWHDREGSQFSRALSLNTAQVKRYLDIYRASPSGGELDSAWHELERMWVTVEVEAGAGDDNARWLAMMMYTRNALAACRMLWAQFNVSLMALGLTVLSVGLVAAFALFSRLGELQNEWEGWAGSTRLWCVRSAVGGGVVGFVAHIVLRRYVKGLGAVDYALFGAALASSLGVIVTARLSLSSIALRSLPLPLILHTLAFASNSFTVWEDRVILFLLISSIVPSVIVGFTAPTVRLRLRILGFSALFAICVRLMATSTVCREEQQPYCHVTFFASSTLPSPPFPVLLLAVPAALALPWGVLRGTLRADNMRFVRTWLARITMSGTLFGLALWYLVPLCLEIVTSNKAEPDAEGKTKKEVTVIGFANAYGAPYLIFWCTFLGLLYPVTQLTGQLVLGLATIAVLAHLEVVDSVRDVRGLEAAVASANMASVLQADSLRPASVPLRFAEVTPLALLALHTFYSTGHQSAIPSIQWKSAFMLTPTLTYPFSPLLVILNTFGPQFLLALAVPLLALWNVAPLPQPGADLRVRGDAVRAALGMMLYHAVLLFGSAVCSAWLRRHLMVWKVFAPRFMCAAVTLVVVDLAVLLGVGLGVGRISGRVSKMFSAMGSK
ncbi:GPI ethanolamine phosphate transferase 3, partial [Grifola frondosa]